MHNLIRFYNQNRRTIFIIILVIVLLLILIQILNEISKKNSSRDIINTDTKISENLDGEVISDKSAVSGTTISKDTLKSDTEIIKEFMEYGNSGDIENAYNLLSESCKNNLFQNIDEFNKFYFDVIFGQSKKIYTIENWSGKTYRIKISEDLLSTGDLNGGMTRQDYITIVEEDGNKKLNVNGFIENINIDKEENFERLNIRIVSEDKYMDYTTFTFEITNNSGIAVLLDTLENFDSMFIQDSNGVKYNAYASLLTNRDLLIDSNSKKQITIKYFSKYNSTRKIKNIVFSNLILKYYGDEYINGYDTINIAL